MGLYNLAAAIIRCFDGQLVVGPAEAPVHLTNEATIDLADWLQREPSLNAWRSIPLAQPSAEPEIAVKSRRISPIRSIK